MSTEQLVALLTALAACLGAWLELRRGRHERELHAVSERVRAVEVRCEILERKQ